MNRNLPPPPPSGINLGDIYYVLFRHKWMILLFSLAGFGAAAYLYLQMAPPFQSEAKLLVRYVQDSKSLGGPDSEDQVKRADARGDGIISGEAEILTSLDVLGKVVDLIGADKILGENAATLGSTNRDAAAMLLKKNLIAEVPKRGNVLSVTFQHQDPKIIQPVLRQVIDTYFKKHVEVHRALGVFDDFLQQQTDQVRANLAITEDELRKLKAKANVVTLEETRRVYADHYARLRQELFTAEVELAERTAALNALKKLAPADSLPALTVTNTSPEEPTAIPSADLMAEFKRLNDRLDATYKKEQDLLTSFTPENSLVKEIRARIAELVVQKKQLETDNPGLLAQHQAVTRAAEPAVQKGLDLTSEMVRVTSLTARIKELSSQFDKIKAEAIAVDDAETAIVQLERKKQLEESQYRYYSSRLEEARLDAALSAGKIANISEIQAPSPPARNASDLQKKLLAVAGGGIGAGLGLAFLLEMFLKQTVRRPTEITSNLGLPLLLTIPNFSRRGRRRTLKALKARAQLTNGEGGATNGDVQRNGHSTEIAPWDESHDLHPFSEALRDRLVTWFDLRGMTHKPKLIALTSCHRRAGVTTLASGLAASLSETGEGNVLLVDMNLDRGAAHPFFRGKPGCGLEDVLTHEKREDAMVHDKLYMVDGTQADDRLPRILPKRIAHLLPKLQASDYDYIIFDMPPITQTSVTPRIAGLMDMVLVVVEDEKTNRDIVKQASSLLTESKANIGVVYNRRRSYVPQALLQEF